MKKVKNIKNLAFLLLVIVIFVLAIFAIFQFSGKKKEAEIVTTSTLEKIINVSELSTFEATYNGIAEVMNEKKPEKVDYYVAYNAKIRAGINFEKVEIKSNDEKKQLIIRIPEITLEEPEVDAATMEYIFIDKKAETETVMADALEKCQEDAKKESEKEDAIYLLAKQNAENIVRALVSPFIEDMDEEYELVIE